MTVLSSQVTELLKRGEEDTQVLQTYGSDLSQQVEEALRQELGAKAANLAEGSVLTMLQTFGHVITSRSAEARSADMEMQREVAEDKQVLEERDRQVRQSRDGLIRLKRNLESTYGLAILSQLGIQGEVVDDPVVLERLLSGCVTILAKNPTLPPPLDAGVPTWTVEGLRQRFSVLAAPLQQVISDVKRESRETQQAQIQRRLSRERLNRSIVSFNAMTEHLARFVGQVELADRIRPRGGGRLSTNVDDASDDISQEKQEQQEPTT